MYLFRLAVLVSLSFLIACGDKDAAAFDPAGQEWEFSLSNPLPIVHDLKVPTKLPLSGRLRSELLGVGDVLRIEGDTVFVDNDHRFSFTGYVRKFPLFTTDVLPDSLSGMKLSQGVGTALNVAFYSGDTLKGEWLFEPKKERLKEIAFGELSGQTYRCAFPGGDTLQVHFGTTTVTYGQDEGNPIEYFVEESGDLREERSYLKHGRLRFWGSRIVNMRKNPRYFYSAPGAYGSKHYTYGRDESGRVIASYIEVDSGRYERVGIPLLLMPPLVPPNTAEQDFADRINSGRVLADNSYPRIDSADVSYAYQKDYRGLEYDELSELEFSAEPGGEFIVVVRDRLLMNQKWKLSPDGHYLITIDNNGQPYGHFPILAYNDEHIDLRMPFSVKTREPRGVALESYAEIDVFIRIVRRPAATSR